MKLLSIHIVTYNNQSTLQRTISSIMSQKFQDFSVFAVDNYSNDLSLKILKKNKIPTIALMENIGYAAAHNLAISKTSSKYVLTLNPDIVLDKNCLGKAIHFLEKNNSVGSINPLLFRVTNLNEVEKIKKVDSAGLMMRKNRKQALISENKLVQDIPNFPQEIFGADGAAAFYRREMLINISVRKEVFDEDFFCYKEDVDLAWRARLLGWKSFCVPKAYGYHIRSFRPGRRATVSQNMKTLSVRNRYLLIAKNDRFNSIINNFPIIIAYEIKIFIYILFFEQLSIIAYLQALLLLPQMFKKRKFIKKMQRFNVTTIENWFI